MSISTKDEKNFKDYIVNNDLLAEAIEWIKSNLDPTDVFDISDLEEWAEDNDYVKSE